MKRFISIVMFTGAASVVQAQDQMTLRTGENINVKVAEVGLNEIRYYKSGNAQGPVYVISKADVFQITYQNKTTDVFNSPAPATTTITTTNSQPVVVQERVIIERSPYYRRPFWPLVGGIVIGAHLPVNRYYGGYYGYGGRYGGHHGRRH